MDRTSFFRRALVLRLLRAAVFAAPLAAIGAGAACGTSGGGGNTNTADQCYDFGTSQVDGGPVTCPSKDEANKKLAMGQICGNPKATTEPVVENGRCCYQVEQSSCAITGRPFVAEGRNVAASPLRSAVAGAPGGWEDGAMLLPDVAALSAAERAELAEGWARDGLMEHASVASFGRFALELMAVGAPAALVEAAHRAAIDEVRHARASLTLAGAYAGGAVAPSPFPFGGSVEVSADLVSIAARAAEEGCIGETLAAVQAAEQLAVATDPAVRAVLAGIAEDEARHAELAWQTVAWAIAQGGEPVRAAVACMLAGASAPRAGAAGAPAPSGPAALAAHGRIDAAALRALSARALADVIRPCARALLAPATPGRSALS